VETGALDQVDNRQMNDERIDLGGMIVVPKSGIDIQVQADQESGLVSQVTFAAPQGAVQVQPFAAPRSGGMWEDIRTQIMASVTSQGGLAEVVPGRFGDEIMAQLPQAGGGAMQPLRFTALEGPRWLLRAVFLGAAARNAQVASPLEDMVEAVQVVRGDIAMPVGAPIPLRLPTTSSAPAASIPEQPSA
jgi:hypothetical protein